MGQNHLCTRQPSFQLHFFVNCMEQKVSGSDEDDKQNYDDFLVDSSGAEEEEIDSNEVLDAEGNNATKGDDFNSIVPGSPSKIFVYPWRKKDIS